LSRRDRAFHDHGEAILEQELHRARRRLAPLAEERRSAVEAETVRVVAAMVESMIAESRREPAVARALASIYGSEPVWEPQVVSWAAD